jgi:putative hemolysin
VMDNPVLHVILIIVLIILNGIFSAGEFAIVSSRKSRIKEMSRGKNERRGAILMGMKENPEKFLSLVQIGITLFGTLASAIGGVLSVKYLKPIIQKIPGLRVFDDSLSIILVVVLLTYLFLVIGELVPKYIGINYREKVAFGIAPLFDLGNRIFFFLVNILTFSTMSIVRALGLKKGEEHIGESDIKMMLEEGRRKGVFDRTEEELIHGVFDFADRSVKEVMVSRPNIYSINVDENREKVLQYVFESEFSRYPVYKDYPDNVIGVVFHKDIVKSIWREEPFELGKLLKKPFFVPESMKISILLKEMQKRRLHLAVVSDEYGNTVGMVTLEDIMEEIFGEILDETDVDDRIERLRDGSFIVDGSYSIRDLNGTLGLTLEESPEYETLGGFILAQLQGVAKGGEIIYGGPYRFTVVGIQGRRISKVKIEKTRKEPRK